MKIVNGTAAPKPAAGAASGRASANKGASTAAAPSSASGAASAGNTAVIDPSEQLSQLEAKFSQADFNVAKVSEVAAAIASGKYQVNTGAVADKLLESTAALGRKSGGNS
jgi:negative regulator of flagellin synthesis FlgM